MALQLLPPKELASTHSVKKWHPPECLFYKSKSGCRFGEKCSYAHRQVDEQPSKRFKKNDDKSAVAMLKKSTLTKVTKDRGDLIRIVLPIMS